MKKLIFNINNSSFMNSKYFEGHRPTAEKNWKNISNGEF